MEVQKTATLFLLQQNASQHEMVVLEEWERIQNFLYTHVLMASNSSERSWRSIIEIAIKQITHNKAQICWDPLASGYLAGNDQRIEIRCQQTRYGILRLASGYLTSQYMPGIPQAFAQLCALLVTLAEHRTLVQALLRPLEPLIGHEDLTPREQDVLESMALGEDETAATQRLGIALTTLRTHRHHVFNSLGVHTPQQAVLRSFVLRLLDWLQ